MLDNKETLRILDKVVKSMKIPVFLIDSNYEILSLNENGKTLLSEYKKSVRREQNLKIVLKNDPILFGKIERMFQLKIDDYKMEHQVDTTKFEVSSNFVTIEKKKDTKSF